MTTLTCPKCRQGMPDEALDAGQCPACGFPLDGPVVLGAGGARSGGKRMLVAVGIVALLAGAGFAGYSYFNEPDPPNTEVADRGSEPEPAKPVVFVAPFPHEPKRAEPGTAKTPEPEPPKTGDKGPPVAVEPPKRDGPRPVPVKIDVNPKIAPVRHFDNPDDIVAVPDLTSKDRVVLTGRVRTLRLSQVHGKGSIDASGLVAEEVEITGDLNSEAVVTVNAPGGKVTLKGWVAGSSKVTITASGGEVVLDGSGRFTNAATITITAKRLETKGLLTGGAKVNATLTAGGSMKISRADEGATVTYRKAGAAEPALVIERGDFRGGAKIVAGN